MCIDKGISYSFGKTLRKLNILLKTLNYEKVKKDFIDFWRSDS